MQNISNLHQSCDADSLFAEGNRYLLASDLCSAQACFERARELMPESPEIWANLAYVQALRGALDNALACYRQALLLQPDSGQILQNLAMLLLKAKQFDEAELMCRRALAVVPEQASAWSNLGVLLASVKRETEAEYCYRNALRIDADYGRARFNLAYLLLRQCRLEEGWSMLEGRMQSTAFGNFFNCPRWLGESLDGKTVVVCLEAGHGDMIQFVRYCADLKQAGAIHIAVICHPALKTLFLTQYGVDQVFASDEHIPPAHWDYWVPVLSLPGLCGTRPDSIPAPIPYLAARPALAEQWAVRLPEGLKVGLAWKGNPGFENDLDRSLPSLDILAPLGAVPGVRFIGLQKGPGQDEMSDALEVLALGPVLADFADTAALIANLNLVISVDTAVAHLAGALGKPCWLLLPDYLPDWRWMAGRLDTPWYPAMRLFRQPSIGGWEPLIKHVTDELAHWRQQHA